MFLQFASECNTTLWICCTEYATSGLLFILRIRTGYTKTFISIAMYYLEYYIYIQCINSTKFSTIFTVTDINELF